MDKSLFKFLVNILGNLSKLIIPARTAKFSGEPMIIPCVQGLYGTTDNAQIQ